MKRATLALVAWQAFAQAPEFVRIPEARFQMARTETTFAQFAAFVKATGYRTSAEQAGETVTWKAPGFKTKSTQPVVQVSPADAIAYCAYVGARLPTDAEWQQAAAAGATTRHYWGNALDDRYLWHRGNSNGRPQPVGGKLPNAWGLYDVEGNVWEWSLSPAAGGDPMANRRGGSWIACEDIDGGPGRKPGRLIGLSTYFKVAIKSNLRRDDIGFRCARDNP